MRHPLSFCRSLAAGENTSCNTLPLLGQQFSQVRYLRRHPLFRRRPVLPFPRLRQLQAQLQVQVVSASRWPPRGLQEGVQVSLWLLFPAARGARPGRSPEASATRVEALRVLLVLLLQQEQVVEQAALLVVQLGLEFGHFPALGAVSLG